MAGLGIDAAVLSKLSKGLKKKIGVLAYLPAIGRALPKAKPFAVRVDLDGVAWDGDVSQIVVGNTRRYAEVTSVTPEAIVDDGRLDVCLLLPANPVSALDQLATLLVRQHPNERSSINDRVGKLTVRTSAVTPLQADGGRVKQDDVKLTDEGVVYEFTVRAQALTVLVPRDYSGTLFQATAVAAPLRWDERPWRQTLVPRGGGRGRRHHRGAALGRQGAHDPRRSEDKADRRGRRQASE